MAMGLPSTIEVMYSRCVTPAHLASSSIRSDISGVHLNAFVADRFLLLLGQGAYRTASGTRFHVSLVRPGAFDLYAQIRKIGTRRGGSPLRFSICLLVSVLVRLCMDSSHLMWMRCEL